MNLEKLTFLLLITFFSCTNEKNTRVEKSPRIKTSTQLINPIVNERINLDDSINVLVKTKYDSIDIKEIHVVYKKDTIQEASSNHLNLPAFKSVGKHKLKIIAVLSNSKKETHYTSMIVYPRDSPKKLKYKIKNIYSHDPDAYTQGLTFDEDRFFEGTGRRGYSTLREVDLKTGKIIKKIEIDQKYFGEGITIYKDKIYQLTWESNVGFVYDKNSMVKIDEFNYNHEGWGITTFGNQLLISDGSENIYFLDPRNYKLIKKIQIYDNKGPVKNINELENVDGKIYANIYGKEELIIFDPNTGVVESVLDLNGIFNKKNYNKKFDVLNGVAYNSKRNQLFVTGKLWPSLFEIEIIK